MAEQSTDVVKPSQPESEIFKCGIIMPIASMGDYPAAHWQDVKSIIKTATQLVDGFKFKTEIVSDSNGEITVIHKNIIQNIYNSALVICDISGKNPNVLFELGMRLAFDKPTIIIKDDQTDFIFDTNSIETLTYPKDLRFSKIEHFQKELALRIKQTFQKSLDDPSFSTFLGNFGEFKIPQLDQTPISDIQQLILEEVSTLKSEIRLLKKIPFKSKEELNENFKYIHFREEKRVYDFYKVLKKYFEKTKDNRPGKQILNSPELLSFLEKQAVNLDSLTLPPEVKLALIEDLLQKNSF